LTVVLQSFQTIANNRKPSQTNANFCRSLWVLAALGSSRGAMMATLLALLLPFLRSTANNRQPS